MSETGDVRYGSSRIGYTVNRSRRRKKTIEITVDGKAGVLVTAPEGISSEDVAAIVRRRARWLIGKASTALLREPHPRQFVSGETVPYLGRTVRMVIEESAVRRPSVRFRHWSLEVLTPAGMDGPGGKAAIRRALTTWYKQRARDRLDLRLRVWAKVLGLQPVDFLIRDQQHRWASCSPDGTLRFNWRVVMAEPKLLDYIVVHELVHLDIKNHSAAFWTRLASALPDYADRRRRLREVGPYLSL
ncbi:MAG TPA: SprT family zinc-dependent metalloprotease [Chloroflexota bacterium]|nr:SprT family zinc-dependent metalloprotease [Chloroflexota bacterium]